MTIYGPQIDMAKRMIDAKGGQITLSVSIPGERDPITQEEVGGQQFSINTRGVILPPGKSRDFEPGSLVGRNVVECWVAAKGISQTPGKGWTLSSNGKTWTIFWDQEYAPDGTPILWKFYAEA